MSLIKTNDTILFLKNFNFLLLYKTSVSLYKFASKLFWKQRKFVQNKKIHGKPYFVQDWKKPRGFLRYSLQFFFASVKGECYLLSVVSQTIFLFLCLLNQLVNFYRQWMGELIEGTAGLVCVCVCVCVCCVCVCIIFTGNCAFKMIFFEIY